MAAKKSRLGELSRDELEDIVEEMALRRPELAALVERPRRGGRVKPGVVLAEVDGAFEGIDHRSWRSSYTVASDLSAIAESAEALLKKGDVASAVRTLCELSEGIRENYGTFHDEESEVARVLDEAIEGLRKCLAMAKGALRTAALEALVDTAIWEELSGGYGVANEVPKIISQHATRAERAELVARVEASVPRATSDYSRRGLGALLLGIGGEALDDERLLDLARKTGRHAELADRLLGLGRDDEAVRLLDGLVGSEAVAVANVFVRRRKRAAAEATLARRVRALTGAGHADRAAEPIVEWLLARALTRKDAADAAKWAVDAFRIRPSTDTWNGVRAHADGKAAQGLLREHARRSDYRLLVDLHVADGNVDAARAAWKKLGGARIWDGGPLATALAKKYPADAASIWLAEVDDLVKRGNRSSYRTAGGVLRRARDVLRKARNGPFATQLLATAREKHRDRPAFLDELSQCLR